ncbi:type II toxin-antitoxin system toxin TscT [Staphylococcus hominis]|uniref:type II toxin-antitoxin system toxin TscT n=1 Tax=Staphylococcus hominis TaxID=1290 RepID=UPI00265BD5E4|nr:DUF1474 family protein [Staphylococcus hominis]MDO0983949.1 DUF1474 family protein [Staphylococcus hominis]
MNFEQSNILCDLEILKEKLEDLYTTHAWHFDDVYIKREIQTQKEISNYLMGYSENRIQHTQHSDLLHMYLKEFDSLLERFKELNKKETLSESDQTTDNEELKNY